MRARFYTFPVMVLALMGCQQSVTPAPLRSLAGSGRVSLVCLDATSGEGRDALACPVPEDGVPNGEDRHTLALLTQKNRGEVAVIDLHEREVLDQDPWIPGTEFLPVGAEPRAIVSTPGGIATFVATAETGLEAIYALPTTCITAPKEGERARDVTLWAACRLPGRPGEMAIVTDPTPDTLGFRQACPASAMALAVAARTATPDANSWFAAAKANAGIADNPCPADLALEEHIAPAGRRKLLVTLPDQGKIAIFDAQALLNLGAGTFQDCIPDSVVALTKELAPTPVVQPLPLDLQTKDASGTLQTSRTYGPELLSNAAIGDPRPAGIALSEGKLYVADLNVPLIHVVDVSDPCSAHEDVEQDLRPLSFDSPGEAVFARAVSVSSQTLAGAAKKQRFLYAVEKSERAAAMVFDLSEGASLAPVVRNHSVEIPFEPADRIQFGSPISQLQLVTHDVPALDANTNTAEVGVLCNPYPNSGSRGEAYRTDTSDYSGGAGPRKLRGIFGVMALGSGLVTAVDIEDWDGPCRRPRVNNPTLTGIDWRGCQHDPALGPEKVETDSESDESTVSDESSCNVIEPHRSRSAAYFRTDSTLGMRAPSLVTFPRLGSTESGDLPTGMGDKERQHPQMLAVPFNDFDKDGGESSNAFLNVATTRYGLDPEERYLLKLDPARAENNSLLLPLYEPRAYSGTEEFAATFEGTIGVRRTTGFLPMYPDNDPGPGFDGPLQPDEILLRDSDAHFCSMGVEDYQTAVETGRRMGLTSQDKRDLFARSHADFVVLIGDFLDSNAYFKTLKWSNQRRLPQECADVAEPGVDLRDSCEELFGTDKEKKRREFLVRKAQDDDLLLTPRDVPADEAAMWVERVRCCFPPTTHAYEVRAGNQWVVRGNRFYHKMSGNNETACHVDSDVRRAKLRGRAFEIASSDAYCAAEVARGNIPEKCAIGAAREDDICVVDYPSDADDQVSVDDAWVSPAIRASAFGASPTLSAECVYESLKGRFAIYRGLQASKRDMSFRWTVKGGFNPLSTTIASSSAQLNVVPTDMVYSETLGELVVVDGASGGLSVIQLADFAPDGQPYL